MGRIVWEGRGRRMEESEERKGGIDGNGRGWDRRKRRKRREEEEQKKSIV